MADPSLAYSLKGVEKPRGLLGSIGRPAFRALATQQGPWVYAVWLWEPRCALTGRCNIGRHHKKIWESGMVPHNPITQEEVATGIHMITSPLGGRRLQFYALQDGNSVTLFDAGLPGSVTEWISQCKLRPTPSRIVISHADADHLGDGNALRRNFPDILVLAHSADQPWIESPQLLVQERYNCVQSKHGIGYSQSELFALVESCGGGVHVDETISESDELLIDSEPWTVLFVPGHSPGHIAIWNDHRHILLMGDAALGFGVPSYDGRLAMPPTHQFIEDYLATLKRLEQLDVEIALTGHWPPLDRSAFRRLVRDSQECVWRDLDFLRHQVRTRKFTFAELMKTLNDRFRAWPEASDIHYFYALSGYLDYLKRRGEISIDTSGIHKI